MKNYDDIISCEIPEQIPLLPLTSASIFPYAIASIQVRLERSIRLLESASDENDIIGTVITKKGITIVDSLKDVHEIGVAARIVSKVKIPNNTYQLVIQGLRRIKINRFIQNEPFLIAHVDCYPKEENDERVIKENKQERALSLFQQLTEYDNRYAPEMVHIMHSNSEDFGRFADLMASYLHFGLGQKQYLVSAVDQSERYDRLIALLKAEVQKLKVAVEVERQVRVDVDRTQREYYLRQQLEAIKKALGEDQTGSDEVQVLRQKLSEKTLPEDARKTAEHELDRLASISSMSPEHNVIRTYLDWILELPWNESTEDKIDIKEARRVLEEDHYGLEKVKERILEFLATRHRQANPHGPILCLAGPPGVGKTSLGHSIARALGRKFERISVGGMRDEAEIRGHRRTYIGAMPGKIIQELRNAGVNNPLFMIDEIDKMGSDFRGDPSSAMLEVLDPEQNNTFRDHYLDLPFDLSKVFFITTANILELIPGPLRDRMEVIEISGYTPREKVEIAKRYLVQRQMESTGLREGEFEVSDEALMAIISGYTYEAGVRNLEREIASLCRKSVVRILEGGVSKVSVTAENLHEFLGPVKIIQDVANREPEVGIVTGLAWTPVGGDLLFIETIKMPGNGKVRVTGRLGEVMGESVQAAYSFVRSRASEIGIDAEDFDNYDVHIHFPEGAIPKDGPSAGVAVTIALISLFTGQPVNHLVAMTGEVTLQGKVLPIGGLKEKTLAAYRGGIKKVLFPEANIKDLSEIPEEVRNGLEMIPIKSVAEALQHSVSKIVLPTGEVVEAIENMTHAQRRSAKEEE